MANKKTLALSEEQYNTIIETMVKGFTFDNKEIKANCRIATILVLEANLGLRVGDILQLKLNNIVKDGERYRLDIIEDKTEKTRTFTVPVSIYNYIKTYCENNNIKETAKIFQIGERAVQKHLKVICDYLGYKGISTHSFRKFFATKLYINNDYDISLVQKVLQHSVATITQKYIGIENKKIETALENNINLIQTF
ncbi:UNVERIFIED_ORG: integrase [Clostridium botulinum]